MEQTEKTCENCKFYIEHYYKVKTSFQKMHDGHCTNDALNPPRKRNKFQLYENCAHWESNEEQKSEKKESIKSVLKDMRDRLIQIEKILSDDL